MDNGEPSPFTGETLEQIETRLINRCATGERFECPRCGASHSRGAFDGFSLYRCLRCGYSGAGYHPDEDIDAVEFQQAIRNEAIDVWGGLTEWVGVPRVPPERGEFGT